MAFDTEHAVIVELFNDTALGAQRVEVPAGTMLFGVDHPADNVYFVVQGQVRTYQFGGDGSVRLAEILGPGDWFGTAGLAQLPHHMSQATAATATVVLQATADRVLAVLMQRPQAAVQIVKQLVQKLHSARDDAARLVFDDCNQRLLKTLVRFSASAAAAPHGEGVVLRITHHQLAQAVGVARETVSLALTQLRHQNVLRTGRNQLYFNPDDLRQLVDKQPAGGSNGHAPTGNGNGAAAQRRIGATQPAALA